MADRKKHEFDWFYGNEWKAIKPIILSTNTGPKMEEALKALHSGVTYRKAAIMYGVSFQGLHQWLTRTTTKINQGRISIG